ncbi:hypothetical protein [Pseudomonas jinjuensis]|uniref:hypothetical protein n=1 Tax=Pseudomonas jinjuensis TaxID=198616 RepID=UPI0011145A75|nr:hypothetical protein [Pseudomonas jinjuensis]
MKADWDDAPSYLRTRGWRSTAKKWVIPGIIGTCIALGLLQAGSSALLQGTVRNLAAKYIPPQSTPIAQISRSGPNSEQDKWDRIVEEQARRNSLVEAPQAPINQYQTEPPPKQTVFNDRNYVPRGADNVVPLQVPPTNFQSEPAQPRTPGVRVTVVGETHDMKETACWPLREGSIEKRNCKFGVGLHYRNQN